jgi:Zn-dependent peptidase ImmA (M78 family)
MPSSSLPKADLARATDAARGLLESLPSISLPIDPVALARAAGVDVQGVMQLNIDFSGCLVNANGNWGILYRDDIPSDGFRRFTVAHELGHYEIAAHHAVIFSGVTMHVSDSGFTSHLWYEQEADHFAAELLMPEDLFREEIRATTLGLPAIKKLAETFNTSLTSTAIRYAKLSPDPVAIIVSSGDRIQYCFTSPCMKSIRANWIERATKVPAASETGRHFKAGTPGGAERQGSCYLSAWFTNASRDLQFNEDMIDLGRYGKTLTVLHATQIPDEEEMAQQDLEEDPDADKFNRDGKRVRF